MQVRREHQQWAQTSSCSCEEVLVRDRADGRVIPLETPSFHEGARRSKGTVHQDAKLARFPEAAAAIRCCTCCALRSAISPPGLSRRASPR